MERASAHNAVQHIRRIRIERTVLFARHRGITQWGRHGSTIITIHIAATHHIREAETHPIAWLQHWIRRWFLLSRNWRESFQHIAVQLGWGASVTTGISVLSQMDDIFRAE